MAHNIMKNLILHPETNDVLCGRGKCAMLWHGNVLYHELIKKRKHRYRFADNGTKKLLAEEIIEHIRSLTPPGRFLKLVDPHWIEIDHNKIYMKTRQALREKLKPRPEIGGFANARAVVDDIRKAVSRTQNNHNNETRLQSTVGIHQLEESTVINAESKDIASHYESTFSTSKVIINNMGDKVPSINLHGKENYKLTISANGNPMLTMETIYSNDSPKIVRQIDNSINHPVSYTELKVNARINALREAESAVNEKIKALKEAELAVAESLQQLGSRTSFIESNSESLNNHGIPEIIGSDSMLEEQNVLPINYNMENLLAIEALKNAKKSLNHVPESNYNLYDRTILDLIKSDSVINYTVNGRVLPATIKSDSEIEDNDHSTVPKHSHQHESFPLMIKEEIAEQNTQALSEDVKPFHMIKTEKNVRNGEIREIIESKEDTSNNHEHVTIPDLIKSDCVMNYTVNDRAIPEKIRSDSEMKDADHNTVPKAPHQHVSFPFMIKEEIAEQNTQTLREYVKPLSIIKTENIVTNRVPPENLDTKEDTSNNHEHASPPNVLASLVTDNKRKTWKELSNLYNKRLKNSIL